MVPNPVRVLLVDDDEDEYVLTREMLSEIEGVDFSLDWESTFETGLRAIEARRHDVYLLDYHLGAQTGLDLLREARIGGAQAPFILLTGQGDRTVDLEAMSIGAADFLLKGRIDPWQLERSIRYAIERARLQEELRALSLVDELTGLYNRRGFFTLAGQQLRLARRMQNSIHILFVDVDNLKAINDKLGHAQGDKALIEIAEILQETFRESDIVARFGGDEFVVLTIGPASEGEEAPVARLEERIRSYNNLPDRPYDLSVSTGIVRCETGSAHALDALLAQADELMYQQKLRKRNTPPPQSDEG
jgi:diguanylate cyclase (GGDEF)-like protein